MVDLCTICKISGIPQSVYYLCSRYEVFRNNKIIPFCSYPSFKLEAEILVGFFQSKESVPSADHN